jgi:hypothetical protein
MTAPDKGIFCRFCCLILAETKMVAEALNELSMVKEWEMTRQKWNGRTSQGNYMHTSFYHG